MEKINQNTVNLFEDTTTDFNMYEIKVLCLLVREMQEFKSKLSFEMIVGESDAVVQVMNYHLDQYNLTKPNFLSGANGLRKKGLEFYNSNENETIKIKSVDGIKNVNRGEYYLVNLSRDFMPYVMDTNHIYTKILSEAAANIKKKSTLDLFRLFICQYDKGSFNIPIKRIRQASNMTEKYSEYSAFKFMVLKKGFEEIKNLYHSDLLECHFNFFEKKVRGEVDSLDIKTYKRSNLISNEVEENEDLPEYDHTNETQIKKAEIVDTKKIALIIKNKGSKDFIFSNAGLLTPRSYAFLKQFTQLINEGTEKDDLIMIKQTGLNFQIMCKVDNLVYEKVDPEDVNRFEHVIHAIFDLTNTIILDQTEKQSHRYPILQKPVFHLGMVYFEIYKTFSDDLVDLGIAIAREKTRNIFKQNEAVLNG